MLEMLLAVRWLLEKIRKRFSSLHVFFLYEREIDNEMVEWDDCWMMISSHTRVVVDGEMIAGEDKKKKRKWKKKTD